MTSNWYVVVFDRLATFDQREVDWDVGSWFGRALPTVFHPLLSVDPRVRGGNRTRVVRTTTLSIPVLYGLFLCHNPASIRVVPPKMNLP